ncbi:MAG: M50 family metallopeptidase [Verrucomicrobiales bacterium]|nr:M50 family metallopeptidase [Verrucomicrobiales bacterium]
MFDPATGGHPSPRTPGEKWLIGAFTALGLALVFGTLLEDYEPVKLSVPFFFLSWVLLLALHEFGHALTARALGWKVRSVSIGSGRTLWSGLILGMPVRFRAVPLSGYVLPVPGHLRQPRLREFLIYAAGPGIELAAAAAILLALGPSTLFTRCEQVPVIAAQTFAAVAVLGAVINLVPLPVRMERGFATTDGLGMILCWGRSDWHYARQIDCSPGAE